MESDKINPLFSKTVLLWLLVGVKGVCTMYWKIEVLVASFLFLMALCHSSGQSDTRPTLNREQYLGF